MHVCMYAHNTVSDYSLLFKQNCSYMKQDKEHTHITHGQISNPKKPQFPIHEIYVQQIFLNKQTLLLYCLLKHSKRTHTPQK